MFDLEVTDEQRDSSAVKPWSAATLAVMGLLIVLVWAAYLSLGTDRRPSRRNPAPASFQLDLQEQVRIDPSLVRYELAMQIPLNINDVRAICVGLDDGILVGGDRVIQLFDPGGELRETFALAGTPQCLAVGGPAHVEPGRLYIGAGPRVEVRNAAGELSATWNLDERYADSAVLTSASAAENDVFVADAGNRWVWRFNAEGELLGRLGVPDPARHITGFVVPSAHFDVAVGARGLVHIADPGRLRVTTFTYQGDFGTAWGRPSSALSGFFGCSNPVHFALLPDGRFVTSEKGIPRIKIYDVTGEFQAVVAGPRELGVSEQSVGDPRGGPDDFSFDVAVDRRGRILVLDPRTRCVRVFVAKQRQAANRPRADL